MFKSKQKQCVDKIEAAGHKISKEQVIHAWHVPKNGTSEMPKPRAEHMWLETGGEKAGYTHVVKKHGNDFANQGLPPDQQSRRLPELMEASTTVGRHIGYTRKGGRPVMAVYMEQDQQVRRTGITVGNNGFIVGMNPIDPARVKRSPNGPSEVSDRTMANLYHYPPNTPERRNNHAQSRPAQVPMPQPHKHPTFRW
ncbi:hypothetical protein F5Y16DRAFT_22915 [Xylariaceae sp. FL0255]|nr:hypothetical protein F5Y16DRAFT_22915 [Xylariaceae sp. FL0255]